MKRDRVRRINGGKSMFERYAALISAFCLITPGLTAAAEKVQVWVAPGVPFLVTKSPVSD